MNNLLKYKSIYLTSKNILKTCVMKKVIFLIFLLTLVIASAFTAIGQKSDFTGTWKLDRTKSILAENFPNLVKISVRINGDSLLTERVYDTGDGQEYPFTENVTLDGIEYNITIYEMPRKTKASWSEQDGSLILESTTTYNGDTGPQDFISKETWKVDKANNTFTISFKNKSSGGESEGAFFFNKVVPNI
jgi:hypothetical protein